jgi:molybdopterin-containing oxidoreductase family membrane subunit
MFSLMNVLLLALGYLFLKGTGIWGITIPIGWGFAIINFVWWIGIGHAGTLISAILALLRQSWRNSINRFAEAMTLFAVACAGIFPLAHTGRPWLAYWMFPYPNAMNVWPQFRSPLIWDVFAVSTYYDFAGVLVRRPDSRLGYIARSGRRATPASSDSGDGMARLGPPLASL